MDQWRATSSGKKHGTLPKTLFPRKLKQLVEVLNTDNLIAGFRTCGLHPVSPDPVLAKLPRAEAVNMMDDQIMDHLKTLRGQNEEAGPSHRRTRLNIAAGCAVGDDGSSSDAESRAPPPKQVRLAQTSEDPVLPTGLVGISDVTSLHVGDFAVVGLKSRFQRRLFIGQVTNIEEEQVEVSFLKPTGTLTCSQRKRTRARLV